MPLIRGQWYLLSFDAVEIPDGRGAFKRVGDGGACAVIVDLSADTPRPPELRATDRVQELVLREIPDREFPIVRPRRIRREDRFPRPRRPGPYEVRLVGLRVIAIGDPVDYDSTVNPEPEMETVSHG